MHYRNGILVRRSAAFQVPANAIRRESDGGKWVLDLVRNSACDFSPCRLLLRSQQLSEVFKDQNVAKPLAFDAHGGYRNGNVEYSTARL